LILLAAAWGTDADSADEPDRKERFRPAGEGSVLDTKTGLTWAGTDNQADITWKKAGEYCDALVLDRASDWRLPTVEELKGIFDPRGYRPPRSFHLTGRSARSSARDDATAVCFDFNYGMPIPTPIESSGDLRALCVRGEEE